MKVNTDSAMKPNSFWRSRNRARPFYDRSLEQSEFDTLVAWVVAVRPKVTQRTPSSQAVAGRRWQVKPDIGLDGPELMFLPWT
jgi:hypothetical protein